MRHDWRITELLQEMLHSTNVQCKCGHAGPLTITRDGRRLILSCPNCKKAVKFRVEDGRLIEESRSVPEVHHGKANA